MGYTSEEVQRVVAQALSQSNRQWVPGREGDPMALQKVRSEFEASLIVPEEGAIEVEQHAATILNVKAGSRRVWFLSGPRTQRVFLDDCSGTFGVAWGPDCSTGHYVDLGFRTDDPIDAYLA